MDVKIDIDELSPVAICGENNIGKTNLLRALNLFFNHHIQADLFCARLDIPHHIFHGSQGAGAKSELTGTFKENGKTRTLKITFHHDDEVTYHLNGVETTFEKADVLLSHFSFLFIESHNVNLPTLISTILEKDGLLQLDAKRKKQSQPLEKLREFIALSQSAISDIEKELNQCFDHLTDFDGILKDKKIKISFVEFERLRDVVKTMTSITLFDGNNHGIASKGSGAQRAVFLSLMQYISKHSKKKVIWGIDEPEAFLQPRLQKKVFEVVSSIVKDQKQPVILTTHSQHFIKLNNLSSTYLFKGVQEPREYKRRPGKVYYETNTAPVQATSDFEKAMLIKQHLGISNNDGWEVLPHNVIVEGEEDKKYLETLFSQEGIASPNIVWSGGASKIAGYLQFYNSFAKDLNYKPRFFCIFDNDDEGREQSSKIKPKSYSHIDVKIIPLPRHDGQLKTPFSTGDWEIEDFVSPEKMLESINFVIKNEGYKIINQRQIKDRSKPAHIGKQILKYAEECCNQNNSDKEPLKIDNEGRKKQICLRYCNSNSKSPVANLSPSQSAFIKSII